MAKDYVSTYRQLLKMHTSNGKTQSPRPRQLALNGGNGLARVSIEKPIPGQSQNLSGLKRLTTSKKGKSAGMETVKAFPD